jgi:hypothetical protein
MNGGRRDGTRLRRQNFTITLVEKSRIRFFKSGTTCRGPGDVGRFGRFGREAIVRASAAVNSQRRIAHPARHGPRRRRCSLDPPPATPLPCLMYRLADPRTAHPGPRRRHPAARDQRLPDYRDHQRPHRGLQPATQTGQTHRLRVRERPNSPPDMSALHPNQRAATQTSC